jgi:tetratricopeptide (TPR) repeat protein
MEREAASDPGQQDLVLRARAVDMRPVSRAHQMEALRAWEEALAASPRSIIARLGLASNLVWNVGAGFSSSVSQDLARAEQLLLEILEQEPNHSGARTAMGALRRFQNRLADAKAEYQTAIEIDPNNVNAIRQMGQLLRAMGEPEAAIPYLEKSLLLDPLGLGAVSAYNNLAWCHLILGHLDDAAEFFARARTANPRAWFVHFGLAIVFGIRGDVDEARAALSESLKLNPEINSIARLRAYQAQGQGAGNPEFENLQKKVEAGLRRAGLPEE